MGDPDPAFVGCRFPMEQEFNKSLSGCPDGSRANCVRTRGPACPTAAARGLGRDVEIVTASRRRRSRSVALLWFRSALAAACVRLRGLGDRARPWPRARRRGVRAVRALRDVRRPWRDGRRRVKAALAEMGLCPLRHRRRCEPLDQCCIVSLSRSMAGAPGAAPDVLRPAALAGRSMRSTRLPVARCRSACG